LGISRTTIKDVCKKNKIIKNGNIYEHKTAGGFKWIYKDNYEIIQGEKWKSTIIDGTNISFSNMGRVKYLSGKITYGCKDKAGYYKFAVNVRKHTVHIYIAKLFIGNPPTQNHTVDHINRIKDDNRVENLRWASKLEQNANRVLPNIKVHNSRNVIQYDLNNKDK
jgi:ribosomal protein L15E